MQRYRQLNLIHKIAILQQVYFYL